MKHIQSRANPQFKQLVQYATSSHARRKAQLNLFAGAHLVAMAMNEGIAIAQLLLAASAVDKPEHQALLAELTQRNSLQSTEVLVFDDTLFNEFAGVDSPAGIAALVATPPSKPLAKDAACIVVCDGVQDPGNLGAIIRAAAAAGASDVLLSNDCAFAWAPRVLRGSQGAHFAVNISEGADVVQVVSNAIASSATICALAVDREVSLYALDLTARCVFVVGNEGTGFSEPMRAALAGHTVRIPMPGRVESLNVAQALSIALFERVRQLSSINSFQSD
jgi:RNA methyltransferase, TrmH family